MYLVHPTPYDHPIAGIIERQRTKVINRFSQIQENDAVLEIGCERGMLLSLIDSCQRKVGLDISPKALTDAQKLLGQSAEFILWDCENPLLFKKGEFDVILCCQTLEHIKHPKRILKNIYKLADKQTRIIISIPNEDFMLFAKRVLKNLGLLQVLFKGIEENVSEWHLQHYNSQRAEKEFQEFFEIVDKKIVLGVYLVYSMRIRKNE